MLDYTGFNENVITFKGDDKDVAGKPMTIAGENHVVVAPSGNTFSGFGVASRDGYITVQMSGHVKARCFDDSLSYGACRVVADENGGIKAASEGMLVHVVSIDREKFTADIIF